MSGKKGRSGKRSKHGGWLFLRTSEIPKEKHHIELHLNRLRQGIVDALGGDENINEGQTILINQIVQFQGFLDLVHLYLKEEATPFYVEEERLHIQPALSGFYISCANSISRNIERLGLNRAITKKLPDLKQYIAIKKKETKEKKNHV